MANQLEPTWKNWDVRIRFWSFVFGFVIANSVFTFLLGVDALLNDKAGAVLVLTHIFALSIGAIFYSWYRIKMDQNSQMTGMVIRAAMNGVRDLPVPRELPIEVRARLMRELFEQYVAAMRVQPTQWDRIFGSSRALHAANRCDICGARIDIGHNGARNIFKTAEGLSRCKGACGYKGELAT